MVNMMHGIKEILSEMTPEEKAAICSGQDAFALKGLPRLGVPSILLSDGPHGLRKQDASADFLGVNESVKATCFPTAATLACSFDPSLLKRVGAALAEECKSEGVSVLLGPGVNIKRSPLCGRNFEYFSEDPFVSSKLASGYIKGLQENGVGASIKHFAVNNQEFDRLSVDAQLDERTLREIYLASFEDAICDAKPWTVMCAYNKVNGYYCSEQMHLLHDILRTEWGYGGVVVSDWGAVAHRVEALHAGVDLEMPASGKQNDKKILDALKSGNLSLETLDITVERILSLIQKSVANRMQGSHYDAAAHHQLAKEAAAESIVLLKNESSILPLKSSADIAVIGGMAISPRYQGAGSSYVNASRLDDIYEIICKTAQHVTYAAGYDRNSDLVDERYIREAVDIAKKTQYAVVFAGLIEEYESEGYDRTHLQMPDSHNRLIEAVAAAQPNTVVVLCNGAPVVMPWIDKVNGLLEAYLGGQALGGAITDILFGNANPCGKLAETFPQKLSHSPSHLNFPGEDSRVEYREGIFVGYRYFEKKEIAPLFPFGHGLSYTQFAYTDISADRDRITDADTLRVSVKVKNTGTMAGKEIIQLYIGKPESNVIRAVKELKGFEKIHLYPGEEKIVVFELAKRSFAYYDTKTHDWRVESGIYHIMAASSSQDIRLKKSVYVQSTHRCLIEYNRFSTLGEIMNDPTQKEIADELLAYLTGEGALLHNLTDNQKMGYGMVHGMALCSLYSFSNATFDEEKLQHVLKRLNKRSGGKQV